MYWHCCHFFCVQCKFLNRWPFLQPVDIVGILMQTINAMRHRNVDSMGGLEHALNKFLFGLEVRTDCWIVLACITYLKLYCLLWLRMYRISTQVCFLVKQPQLNLAALGTCLGESKKDKVQSVQFGTRIISIFAEFHHDLEGTARTAKYANIVGMSAVSRLCNFSHYTPTHHIGVTKIVTKLSSSPNIPVKQYKLWQRHRHYCLQVGALLICGNAVLFGYRLSTREMAKLQGELDQRQDLEAVMHVSIGRPGGFNVVKAKNPALSTRLGTKTEPQFLARSGLGACS